MNDLPSTPRAPSSPKATSPLWARIEKTQNKLPLFQSLSHEVGSEQSERASERARVAERASKERSEEQANKWAVRANERTEASEWPSTSVCIQRSHGSSVSPQICLNPYEHRVCRSGTAKIVFDVFFHILYSNSLVFNQILKNKKRKCAVILPL